MRSLDDWFNNIILEYQTQTEQGFGILRFQNVKTGRRGRPQRIALLTEDQAIFYLTLSALKRLRFLSFCSRRDRPIDRQHEEARRFTALNLEWNPPNISDRTARLVSGAEHSSSVVFGFERKDSTIAPARDFFTAAVNDTDLQKVFAEEFDRSGSTDQAFEETIRSLHEAIRDAIKSDRWQWDKTTKRKNGETVSSPRDAVDTRELLESQSIDWVE